MPIIPIESEAHWHELRAKHIGGSEIAALFGASSFLTEFELYHQKRGNIGKPYCSPLMEFGNDMEPIIAKWIAREMGWEIKLSRDYYEHPEIPCLGCTLDYYVLQSEHGAGVLEIKNVNSFSEGWTDTRAPNYVELQVQQQLMVVDAARKEAGLPPFNWAAIGSLHGGNPEGLRTMLRKPDPDVQKAIAKHAAEFWQRVETGNEPDFMAEKDAGLLQKFWERAVEAEEVEMVDVDDTEVEGLAMEYEDLGRQISSLQKQRDGVKGKIYDMLTVSREEPMAAAKVAHTDHYVVEAKQITVNYKEKEAYTGHQTRLKVMEKK